jgi:hypothetical protein
MSGHLHSTVALPRRKDPQTSAYIVSKRHMLSLPGIKARSFSLISRSLTELSRLVMLWMHYVISSIVWTVTGYVSFVSYVKCGEEVRRKEETEMISSEISSPILERVAMLFCAGQVRRYYINQEMPSCCRIKVKLSLRFNWAPRHEGVLVEWTYSSTYSLTSALDGGEWSASRPGLFTSE